MSIKNPSFTLVNYSIFEDDEIQQFINEQQAKATKYSTNFSMNSLNNFCKKIGESRSIEQLLLSKDLNSILCNFFMHVTKKDGTEYEPDSISTIQRGIQRYLDENNHKINILIDEEFAQSRKVLAAKRKQLTKTGKGGKPNATRELEQFEIDKLYSDGYFGISNAESLQRTVWWNISLHFGFRARDESRKLCWGDILLENDTEKGECLVLVRERGTKTRYGRENEER